MGVDPEDRSRARNLQVWLRFEHSIVVSGAEVRALVARLPTAPSTLEVTGRDLLTGLPRPLTLPTAQVRAAADVPPLPW